MIPAWPDDPEFKGFVAYFTKHHEVDFEAPSYVVLRYIKRPQQPSKFKVDDPVFYSFFGTNRIYTIEKIENTAVKLFDQEGFARITDLKPAKLEDLGKAWEEIK